MINKRPFLDLIWLFQVLGHAFQTFHYSNQLSRLYHQDFGREAIHFFYYIFEQYIRYTMGLKTALKIRFFC